MKVWTRLAPAMVIALAVDWATKIWAERSLTAYEPVPLIGEFFRLTLGYNTGVAFGLFANGGSWPLIVTGFVIVGLMVWLIRALYTGDFPPRSIWPIGLLLGGAMANFGDRLLDGRVTDFLDVGLGTARWPTFNMADSFIVTSLMVLMLISWTWNGPQQKEEQPDQSDSNFSD